MFRMTTIVCRMTTAHRINEALAAELRTAIKGDRRTQRDVSERSGIPLVTLNRKLAGRSAFTVVELAAVCEVLDVSLVDIVLRAERASMLAA